MAKRLTSVLTNDMDVCMFTGQWGVERHHVFSHTSNERKLCEKYGFIAPVIPRLHPNGVHRGEGASEVDIQLRIMCQEYYEEHYGTRDDFRREFGKSYLD